MGPKITIDSATLANKGLELIEAHFLFGLPYERIEVVVHPTSIVHALVRFRDGAALAHLGYPDMRVPISYALTYPERAATPVPPLDLAAGLTLEFRAPDLETFPLLALARRGRRARRDLPVRLQRRERGRRRGVPRRAAPFLGIAEVVEDALGGGRRRAGARPRRARRGRREAARSLAERGVRRRMSIFVAILGLGVPDPHPRGRSLLRRARGRDEPAQVLPRLPAGAREDEAERDRVRDRRDPARRLREDPGHAPAGGGRPRRIHFGRAVEEAPWLGVRCDELRARARGERLRGRTATRSRGCVRGSTLRALSPVAPRPPSAVSASIDDALAPTPTGARRRGSASPSSSPGPARTSLFAVILFAVSSWPAAARRRATVDEVARGHARGSRSGCSRATGSSSIDGTRGRRRTRSPSASGLGRRADHGDRRARTARRSTLGPSRPRRRTAPTASASSCAAKGYGPAESTWQAVRVTGHRRRRRSAPRSAGSSPARAGTRSRAPSASSRARPRPSSRARDTTSGCSG